MTATKRLPNKFNRDFQNTQIDISWSSSDSDNEKFDNRKQRNKRKKPTKAWIKLNVNDTCEKDAILDCTIPVFCQISSQATENDMCSKQTKETQDSPKGNTPNGECESPVISNSTLQLSPVINYNSNIDATENSSPVLGKIGLSKKIRSRYKKTCLVEKEPFKPDKSPDLFVSQSTHVIESESPEYNDHISQSSELIDPFPSQCSSPIVNSESSNVTSRVDNSFLYHQPPPKRKRYKTGGLASLLHKTLQVQKTRVAIWQHEMYLKKNYVTSIEGETVTFIVKNRWKEYGSTLLECEILKTEKENNDIFTMENQVKNTKFVGDLVLLIIGLGNFINITFKVDFKYKLFPPYCIKRTVYKSQDMQCYFNVSKLIHIKDKSSSSDLLNEEKV